MTTKRETFMLWVLVVSLVISVLVTYYKTMILKDFEVINTEPELEEALEN